MMATRERVLVVEDEPRLARLVRGVLQAVGYEVLLVSEGESALETMVMEQPDLVLLDILLPHGLDGYEVCRRIRQFSSVPVIMLTAKAMESDKLAGFEAGADDYLTKPFSSKELVARVRALLRRSKHPEEIRDSTIECGELLISLAQHRVSVGGRETSLTPTEYALLSQLAAHPNCVMTHEQLLTQVWGAEYRDDLEYLRAYIRYLRRKIEVDPSAPRYIVNVPGVGYMLACPARDANSSSTASTASGTAAAT